MTRDQDRELGLRMQATQDVICQKAMRICSEEVSAKAIEEFCAIYRDYIRLSGQVQARNFQICIEDIRAVTDRLPRAEDFPWCLKEAREMASALLVGLNVGDQAGGKIDKELER